MKKAQVTIFIILGVILLLIFGLFFYMYAKSYKTVILNPDTPEGAFQLCFQSVAEEAVTMLGEQGGKIYLFNYLDTGQNKIHYSYDKGAYSLPTISEMETELKTYIENTIISFCEPSIYLLEDEHGWNIEYKTPTATPTISDNVVLINLNFPITATKDTKTVQLKDFSHNIKVRLGSIHKASDEIVKFTMENPKKINRIMKDMSIEVIQFKEDIIYKILDPESKVRNQQYRFFIGFDYE